jgi:hypothetical protein
LDFFDTLGDFFIDFFALKSERVTPGTGNKLDLLVNISFDISTTTFSADWLSLPPHY